MENLQLSLSALVLLAAGLAMALYERSTIKAGRPLLAGRDVVVLYWVGYLSLIVLGITAGAAAILK